MKIVNALRRSLVIRPAFAALATLAAVFAAPAAFGGTSGGAGPVMYNIPEQIEQGNMPYTASYTLLITSPAALPVGTYNVSLNLTLLSAPSGVTTSQALSFVTISSNTSLLGGLLGTITNTLGAILGSTQTGAATITFTGPNQTVAVTVTTTIPVGNWAGSFGYGIQTSGWASNLGVTDQGCTINDTVSLPPGLLGLPTVTIIAPVDNTEYTLLSGTYTFVSGNSTEADLDENVTYSAENGFYEYVPSASSNISVNYSFSGNTSDGSPLIAMNGSVNGMDLGVSATGLNLANTTATANGTFSVSEPGTYTVTANDANANGVDSQSVELAVNVQAGPPSVVIDTPPANSTCTLTGNSVSVPFTFTGFSEFGGVTDLVATLDGTPINVSSGDLGNDTGPDGSGTSLGNGTMNLTSTGTHELSVTATDEFGSVTVSESILVVAQTALVPPHANILKPTANQVFTTVAGTPTPVTLSFNGTTTGDPITSLSATLDNTTVTATSNGTQNVALDGNTVTFTFAGLNTTNPTGTAVVDYSTAGNHTLSVTAINDGGNASTLSDFSVATTAPTTSTLAVAITKPAPNSTYAIGSVGGSVSIPDAFVSNSTAASGVLSLNVTLALNGANPTPVTVTPTAFGDPTVTANGTLNISVPGTYTISVTAMDEYNTATASENITVTSPAPCPKVTITHPANGASFQVGTSSCPLYVPVDLTANTTTGSTLSTLTLTLNGQPVTLTSVSGLGKAAANGSVDLKITSAGNYTLVATTTSGNVSATATSTFTVSNSCSTNGFGGGGNNNNGGYGSGGGSSGGSGFGGYGSGGYGSSGGGNNNGCGWSVTQYTCNPPPCNITWQQSWSCSSTQKGGSSLPICFQVQYAGSKCATYWNSYFDGCGSDYEKCDQGARSCWGSSGYLNCVLGNVLNTNSCLNGNWVSKGGNLCSNDTSVKCVVYEVYANGSCGKPKTYTCPTVSYNWWGQPSYSQGSGCNINSNDQYTCTFPTSSGTHTYRCDVYYTDQNSGSDCFLGCEQIKTH
jgi:hypothetical protein